MPPRRRLAAVCRHLRGPSSSAASDGAPTPVQHRRGPDGAWSGGAGSSDPELDGLVAQFRAEGYLKLPHLLTGDLLARTIAAFKRSQVPARADWEAGLANGAEAGGDGEAEGRGAPGTWHAPRYYDTPKILEVDDCFLEVIEEPFLLALACKSTAPGNGHRTLISRRECRLVSRRECL